MSKRFIKRNDIDGWPLEDTKTKTMFVNFDKEPLLELMNSLDEKIDQLQRQNDELVARVARLEKWIKQDLEILDEYQENDEYMACLKLLNEPPTQSLQHIEATGVEKLKFPTMLRKMWSGGEVQEWIKEQAEKLRQQSTNGSDGDE